jgi:hypothetical protein
MPYDALATLRWKYSLHEGANSYHTLIQRW